MIIIIVPTLIAQIIAIYVFYKRHWYNVSQHTSNLIATEIGSLIRTGYYKSSIDDLGASSQNTYLNLEYILLPNANISLYQKYAAKKELEIFQCTIKTRLGYDGIIILDKRDKINLYLQVQNDVLHIILPSKPLLNPTTYIFVMWVVLLTVTLLSVSFLFLKNQMRSIIALTNAADSYGRGEKIAPYVPSGAAEIRRAGLALLKMKDRIAKQSVQRTQMLAMISHDLKTPITRIALQAELIDDLECKEGLKHDADTMKNMINSYLDFARGEGGEEFVHLDINEWIQNYVDDKWSGNNIALYILPIPCLIQIKPLAFARAVDNLISNGLKYSTKINISLSSDKGYLSLVIEDNGEGIKSEDRKKVFKPFYRADKSRGVDSFANVGLGLAITKEIISGHYGTITLHDSKKLKGLMVKIQLPLLAQS